MTTFLPESPSRGSDGNLAAKPRFYAGKIRLTGELKLSVAPEQTEEHILVVPESVVTSIGNIDGFESDVDRFLQPILRSDQLSFQPRRQMETDPSYKQLIPYVLLEWNDNGVTKLFTYTRGGGGGEARLHAKRSVGIGGHISREDAADGTDPYSTGMHRELAEEVQLDSRYEESRVGLLYDPSNDVGKVHLGVVHKFILERPDVKSNEADLAEGGFVSVDQLRSEMDRLETWSQLAITALY
jgi:predicted NUDIX family phosphoesterase